MKKKTRTILKRGIAFVLAMALLWTDASMSTLAANVIPEISATEDLMSATDMTETEQTGSPAPDAEDKETVTSPAPDAEVTEEPVQTSDPEESPSPATTEATQEEELITATAVPYADANELAAPLVTLTQSDTLITLEWTYPSEAKKPTGYRVYRKDDASDWAVVDEEQWNNKYCEDVTVDLSTGQNKVYSYKVTAYDASGEGPESQIVTNKDVPMGSDLDGADQQYQGAYLIDEEGNRIDKLTLHAGEYKKVTLVVICEDGREVSADQFLDEQYQNHKNEGRSRKTVEWSVLKAETSGKLSEDVEYGYVEDVLTSDTLPYRGSSWFAGRQETTTSYFALAKIVVWPSIGTLYVRIPVEVLANDGQTYETVDKVTICDTREDAYQAARDAMVARENRWFLVDSAVMNQGYEALFFDPEEAYDFYAEREGMMPYEGDYLNYTVGDPTATTFQFSIFDYSSMNYRGKSYSMYQMTTPFMTTREQEDAVDAKIDQMINQEGGELYAYRDRNARDKVKAIYDYIVGHVSYIGTTTPVYHTAYSALINGKGTCQAYALLFTRLSREMGVPSKVIMGTDANAHTYNIVELDGKWYYIDTTAKIYLKGSNNFKRTTEQSRFKQETFVENYVNNIDPADYVAPKLTVIDENGNEEYFKTIKEATAYLQESLQTNPDMYYEICLGADASISGDDLNLGDWDKAAKVSLNLNGFVLKITANANIMIHSVHDTTGKSKGVQSVAGATVNFVSQNGSTGDVTVDTDMNIQGNMIIAYRNNVGVRNLTVAGRTEMYLESGLCVFGTATLKDLVINSPENGASDTAIAVITLRESEDGKQNGQIKFTGKLINNSRRQDPILLQKMTGGEEDPVRFEPGEIIATVTATEANFPRTAIYIEGDGMFVEREGNYLKASKNVISVYYSSPDNSTTKAQSYSSLEKAVAALSSDFGSAKGSYSVVFEDDWKLSKDITIPAFVTNTYWQTGQWTEDDGTKKKHYAVLDLNGHSITFASLEVEFSEGLTVTNTAKAASKISLSMARSHFRYEAVADRKFVNADGQVVELGDAREVFTNVSLNAPNSGVDFDVICENSDNYVGITYIMSGDISAKSLEICGNHWKVGNVTAGSLIMDGQLHFCLKPANTELECRNLTLSNDITYVSSGTKVIVDNTLLLNKAMISIQPMQTSDAYVLENGELTAGTINIKDINSQYGIAISNIGILRADKLVAPVGRIENGGTAYVKTVEKIKDIYLMSSGFWISDSFTQVSNGRLELQESTVLIINDKAAFQQIAVSGYGMNEEDKVYSYIYTGKNSTISVQSIKPYNSSRNVAVRFGKLSSDSKIYLDEENNFANEAGKFVTDNNGLYPVINQGAGSILFSSTNTKIQTDLVEPMQADENSKYTRAYQVGQNVYVGGDWITIKAQNADGSDEGAQVLKSFVKWSEASAYLTTLSNSNMTYIVEISEDIDTQETFTLPSKARKVIFRGTEGTENGNDGRIEFRYVGDINLLTDVTFENIDLKAEVYDKTRDTYVDDVKALKLNGKVLELDNSSGEFTTVTGTNTSKLLISGVAKDAYALKVKSDLSIGELSAEEGTVQVGRNATITNATLTNACIKASGFITVKENLKMTSSSLDSNGKITLKNLVSGDDKNSISYGDNSKNILTITGTVSAGAGYTGTVAVDATGKIITEGDVVARFRSAAVDINVKSLQGKYTQNVLLLNAEKAMSSWFVVGSTYSEPEDESEPVVRVAITHLTHKDGKTIKCNDVAKQAVILESCEEGSAEWIYNGGFGTLQEAFSEIDRLADTGKKYNITITDDQITPGVTDIKKALTFPSKAAEVTIAGQTQSGAATISYKGDITLKCNVRLQNLILNPSAAKTTISLGNFGLTIDQCAMAEGKTIGKITGSGINKSSYLEIQGKDLHTIDGELSNIAILDLSASDLQVKGKVTIGKLVIGAHTLETEAAVSITDIIASEQTGNAVLRAPATITRNADKEITKVTPQITINGTVQASIGGGELIISLTEKTANGYVSVSFDDLSETCRNNGVQLAKASKVSTDMVTPDPAQAGETAGIIVKKACYLTYYPDAECGVVLSYEAEDGSGVISTRCLNFADAVTEINSLNKKRDYVITIVDDNIATPVSVPKGLTFPRAGAVAELTIKGGNIYFTGNLTFTSNTILENVTLIQMIKKGNEYVYASVNEYRNAVQISTSGYSLTFKQNVNFNDPVELKGSNKGILIFDKTANVNTDNTFVGSISQFASIEIPKGIDLQIEQYSPKANAFTGGNLQAATVNVNESSVQVAGNATISNVYVKEGQLDVGGKAELTNVVLNGNYAVISVDKEFNINGNLTSTSEDAQLITRRKIDKDPKKCIPFLNVKGYVFLEDYDRNRVNVQVLPNVAEEKTDVKLTGAPNGTAQLLTAAKADADCFRVAPENLDPQVEEYSVEHTDGYILRKAQGKVFVYYGKEVVAALCEGDVNNGKLAEADVINYYTSLNEAVAAIKAMKDKNAEYTILLLQNVGSAEKPVNLDLPAENATLFIRSARFSEADTGIKTIYYNNNVTVRSDLEFIDVNLAPVKLVNKVAQGAKLNFATGAFDLVLGNVTIGKDTVGVDQSKSGMMIGDIAGKGELVLDSSELIIGGNVRDFKNIIVCQDAVIEGSLTAPKLTLENAGLTVKKAAVITNVANDNGRITYYKDDKHNTYLTLKGQVENYAEEDRNIRPLELVLQLQGTETLGDQELTGSLTGNAFRVILNSTKKLANIEKIPMSDLSMRILTTDSSVVSTGTYVKADKAVYWIASQHSETDDNSVRLINTATQDTSTFLDLAMAVNEMNNLNDKTAVYRLEIVGDRLADTNVTDTKAISAMTFPSNGKAKSVTIAGGKTRDDAKQLIWQGTVSYNGDLTFDSLVCNADAISASKLTLKDSALTTTKASSVTNLICEGTATWDILNTATITNLDVTAATLTGENENVISYLAAKQDKSGKPMLTIKGTVTGDYVLCRLIKTDVTAVGAENIYVDTYKDKSLVIAPMEAADKFVAYPFRTLRQAAGAENVVEEISAASWMAYKNRSNYVMNGDLADMAVEIADDAGNTTYAKTFEEAVTIIENANNKRAEYTMTLLYRGDGIVKTGLGGAYGALKLPSKAASVTIQGESGKQLSLQFTGEIKPACDVAFANVLLTDGKVANGVFSPSNTIALNMTNYNVAFGQGAKTGTADGGLALLACTKVTGKKALDLYGQQLICINGGIDVNTVKLLDGAYLQAAKDIKVKDLYAETYNSPSTVVSINAKGAMKLTNIHGNATLRIHSYYSQKALNSATTQLTIDGEVYAEEGLQIKLIPYFWDPAAGQYAVATKTDIQDLTVSGDTPKAYQKLANMTTASAETIELYYGEGVGTAASGNLYKYNRGLYITDQAVAVRVSGSIEGEYNSEYQAEFYNFNDAVAEIDNRNNRNMDYTISLYRPVGVNGNGRLELKALKLPSKAKSITIKPAEGEQSGNVIAFSGNVTLGCNTTVEGVVLSSLKKVTNAKYHYTHFTNTGYNINIGNYAYREVGIAPGTNIECQDLGYMGRNVEKISGSAKGSYYVETDKNNSYLAAATAISGVGTVEFKSASSENSTYYSVLRGISGVNELIVNEATSMGSENGNITANNVTLRHNSYVHAKNFTSNKTITLDGGALEIGTKTVGDGKVSLNNIIVQRSGNLLRGKQDKNGRSMIEVKGTVSVGDGSNFENGISSSIIVKIDYNDKSACAQLYDGMVLLSAPKASPWWFTPAYSGDDYQEMGRYNQDYELMKSGKDLIYGKVADAEVSLIIYPGEADEQLTWFATFEEAVKEIDSLNLRSTEDNKRYANYIISVRKDIEIGNQKGDGRYSSLVLPSRVGTLFIQGENDERHEIRFSGNVSLKSDLVLIGVDMIPVKLVNKQVVSTKANWTLGKYRLEMQSVGTTDEAGNSLYGTISGSSSGSQLLIYDQNATEENPYVLHADQITGLNEIFLNPNTRLEVDKNLTTNYIGFETTVEKGEAEEVTQEAATTSVHVGGRFTTNYIYKGGIGEAVIEKPAKGEIFINGTDGPVWFNEDEDEEYWKLTIKLENENPIVGTKILTCKDLQQWVYRVIATENGSENEYGTYVNGTTLLLGRPGGDDGWTKPIL